MRPVAPAVQHGACEQHGPSGQQTAALVALTARQHGPSGQHELSEQQGDVLSAWAVKQHEPSGQHGPSGQQLDEVLSWETMSPECAPTKVRLTANIKPINNLASILNTSKVSLQ